MGPGKGTTIVVMRWLFVRLLFFAHYALDLYAAGPVEKKEIEEYGGEENEDFPQTFLYGDPEDAQEMLEMENLYLRAVSTGHWDEIKNPSSFQEEAVHNTLAVILNSPKNLVPFQYNNERFAFLILVLLAIEGNQVEVLERIWSWADSQEPPSFSELGFAIMIASRKYGSSGVLKFLAEKGAFAGERDKKEVEQLFLLACKDGDEKLAEALLTFTTDSKTRNMGLGLAAQYGHVQIIKLLLADGRVNVTANKEFSLRIALQEGHVEVAKLLLVHSKLDRTELGKVGLLGGLTNSAFRELDLIMPADTAKLEDFRVKPFSYLRKEHLPEAHSCYAAMLENLQKLGFDRLLMKLGETDPSLVVSLIIKSAADSLTNAPETLHLALEAIISHLKEVPEVMVNLLPFMAACEAGFDDIVDAYLEDGRIIKDYTYLPFFKDTYLDHAFSMASSSRYEPPSLAIVLIKAAANGYAVIVRNLIAAGADPTTSLNAPFNIACAKNQKEVVGVLFSDRRVKAHPLTPGRLFLHLLQNRDFVAIHRLYLGDQPQMSLQSFQFLKQAYKNKLFASLASLFRDPALIAWLKVIGDSVEVVHHIVLSALVEGQAGIIESVLSNLDAFEKLFGSDEISKLTLEKIWLFASAAKERFDIVSVLLKHPKRSKRDTYKLVLRLIQRYPDPSYVMDVLTETDLSNPLLRRHLKYYLPVEILKRMFPGRWNWTSDKFLKAVTASATSGEGSNAERIYQNLFFDKTMGLFGAPVGEIEEGGFIYYDQHFIGMIDAMEKSGRLEPSPRLEILKRHLQQVASAILPEMDEFGGYRDRHHIQERLRQLPVSETYLLTLESWSRNTSYHTLYALVTKTDELHVNVKVFNSYHYALKKEQSRSSPYIEWDGLALEDFLNKCTEIFETHNVLLSHDVEPTIPDLPEGMKTKGQKTGTCSCFKFWLISKHDLGSLARFLEFSVALHLFFIEDLAVHFKERMREWQPRFPRAWRAIISTPHFEAQLLKDIEALNKEDANGGDRAVYAKLRGQIIRSVQLRYGRRERLRDEQAVVDFIQWKDRFLARIPDVPLGDAGAQELKALPACSGEGESSSSDDDSSSEEESSSSDDDSSSEDESSSSSDDDSSDSDKEEPNEAEEDAESGRTVAMPREHPLEKPSTAAV